MNTLPFVTQFFCTRYNFMWLMMCKNDTNDTSSDTLGSVTLGPASHYYKWYLSDLLNDWKLVNYLIRDLFWSNVQSFVGNNMDITLSYLHLSFFILGKALIFLLLLFQTDYVLSLFIASIQVQWSVIDEFTTQTDFWIVKYTVHGKNHRSRRIVF